MTIAELKEISRERLQKDRWFGVVFTTLVFLTLVGRLAQLLLNAVLARQNVMDLPRYLETLARNKADQVTPVPILTQKTALEMVSATTLECFVAFLFAGIACYGLGKITLRCVRNERDGWFREIGEGFRMPFGMVALFLRLVLIFAFWSFLSCFLIGLPFLIRAFYVYSFVWLVKAEHPEWSAGTCLKASRTLTKGHKMQSFKLDCAYWRPLVAMLLLVFGAFACQVALAVGYGGLFGVLGLVLQFAVLILAWYTFIALRVSQGFLYRDCGGLQ